MFKYFIISFLLLLNLVVYSQGSNTCAGSQANQVTLPFVGNNQSLCGDVNDYNGLNACATPTGGGNYYGGQDWLYSFTPNQDGFINITINDIQSPGFAYPTISLLTACPGTPGSCLGFLQVDPAVGGSLVRQVEAGQTYIVLVDAWTWSNVFANCYQFDLLISLTPIITQPGCNNVNFSLNSFTGWQGTTGLSQISPAGSLTPNYNSTGIGIVNGRHTIMTAGNDPCGGFPRVDPLGNPFSVRLGNNDVNSQAEQLVQRFLVTNSNSSFTYRYAVVFEDPGHNSNEQPFFRAILRDQNGNTIQCSEFVVSAAGNLPGFFNSPTCTGVRYKPWSSVNVDLSNYIGQEVTAEFTTGDCSQGAHYGYAYIDAKCEPSLLQALQDSICAGESVTLVAPPGYSSYQWLPGGQNTQSITVTPLQSTVYQLNLVSQNGCLSSTQFTITVFPYPGPLIIYTD